MGRMWVAVGLAGALAACVDEAPPYHLTLEYSISDATGLEVVVDGEPAELAGTANLVRFRIERRYENYAASGEAAPIGFEVRRDGAVLWTHEQHPQVCYGFADQCGDIVAANLSDSFLADGTPCNLCASLACADEGGICAALVASR